MTAAERSGDVSSGRIPAATERCQPRSAGARARPPASAGAARQWSQDASRGRPLFSPSRAPGCSPVHGGEDVSRRDVPSIDWSASSSTISRRRTSRASPRRSRRIRSSWSRAPPFGGAPACARSRSRSHSMWNSIMRRSARGRSVRTACTPARTSRGGPGPRPGRLEQGQRLVATAPTSWSRSASARARLPLASAASSAASRRPRPPVARKRRPRLVSGANRTRCSASGWWRAAG